VIIEANRIAYAGQDKSLKKTPEGQVIDCSGKTILPWIFDAHIYLGAACTFGYIPIDDKRKLSESLYCGVTSVADIADIEDWIFSLRERKKKVKFHLPAFSERLDSTGNQSQRRNGGYMSVIRPA